MLPEPLGKEETEVDKADAEGYNNQDTECVSGWDFGNGPLWRGALDFRRMSQLGLEFRSYSSNRDGLVS